MKASNKIEAYICDHSDWLTLSLISMFYYDNVI